MADQDLNINVTSTADLTALKQAAAELKNVEVSAATLLARQEELRAMSPELYGPGAKHADILTGSGIPFGTEVGGAGTTGLTALAADTERAAKAGEAFSRHLTTASIHAGILARELATGNINIRSLGILAHNIGLVYAGAGAAGIALNKGLTEYTKLLDASTKELDQQAAKVVELSKQWETAAKSVLSVEDIQKVAESGMGEIDKMGQRAREVATEDIKGFWANAIEYGTLMWKQATTWGGIKSAEEAKGAVRSLNDELARSIELDREQLVAAKGHAIELARSTEKSFEALKDMSSADAVTSLTNKIAGLRNEQDALADSGRRMTEQEIQRWIELGQQASQYERKLDEVEKLEQQRINTADKAYGQADEGVRRVLMNERAATEARQAGLGRDADLYTKSAEAYERGLKPAQLDQLTHLREIQRLAYGSAPPSTPQMIYSGQPGFGGQSYMNNVPQQQTSAADEAKWNELMLLLRGH